MSHGLQSVRRVALAVAVATVSWGASHGSAAGPGDMVDPRDGGLEVGLGEWAVTLEAGAIRPGNVTLVVHNGGARAHGFRIRSESGRRGRERFESRTALIPPGGQAKLTVSLQAGTYAVDCYVEEADVGEHDQLGMEALLSVRRDAPLIARKVAPSASAVSIERFVFSPTVVQVRAGTTVEWRNADPAPHTVTAEDGSFDSGPLGAGGTFRHVFSGPGAFPYQCSVHPTMKGRIEVAP